MSQSQPQDAVKVLVVEDEDLIRMDALDFIESSGFTVFEARNADEAIRILESEPEIHVVFTDINMPGSMDGLKLAHYVRRRWPPVRLIVTSGLAQPGKEDLPAGAVFLAKPYRPDVISRQLRAMTANLPLSSQGDQGTTH